MFCRNWHFVAATGAIYYIILTLAIQTISLLQSGIAGYKGRSWPATGHCRRQIPYTLEEADGIAVILADFDRLPWAIHRQP